MSRPTRAQLEAEARRYRIALRAIADRLGGLPSLASEEDLLRAVGYCEAAARHALELPQRGVEART